MYMSLPNLSLSGGIEAMAGVLVVQVFIDSSLVCKHVVVRIGVAGE